MRDKRTRTRKVMIDLVNMNVAALTLSMAAYNFASGKPLDAAALMSVGLLNLFIFLWHPEVYNESSN
jgi:hypothetical protein